MYVLTDMSFADYLPFYIAIRIIYQAISYVSLLHMMSNDLLVTVADILKD